VTIRSGDPRARARRRRKVTVCRTRDMPSLPPCTHPRMCVMAIGSEVVTRCGRCGAVVSMNDRG